MSLFNSEIEKIDWEGDPDRCKSNGAGGQCPNKGVMLASGTRGEYCRIHSASSIQVRENKRSMINITNVKFNDRIKELASNPNIKSLRDEIAILRLMLEEKFAQIEDSNDLLLASKTITELIETINNTVKSAHLIDKDLGVLVDKETVAQFGQKVLDIIMKHVTDKDTLAAIAEDFTVLINNI